MTPEFLDRRALKQEARSRLAGAQVSPKGMTALYLGLLVALNLLSVLVGGAGLVTTFVGVFTTLLSLILNVGFILYCIGVYRGERMEYLTLFDGFSMVGKVILLNILIYVFISLWSMLFVVPGIIAAYRYRFAIYNLCMNPELSVREALNLSKLQTMGYKGQLFMLDVSFLGWTALSMVPSLIYNFFASQELLASMTGAVGAAIPATIAAAAPAVSVISLLPGWGWTLLMGLWNLGVSLFYAPAYQCTEFAYFEAAVRSSHLDPEKGYHPNFSRPDRPDNLGGFR